MMVCLFLFLPVVSAVQLPMSYKHDPFTVTVSSYQLSADNQHATVYGTAQSDSPVTIRILSADGTVKTLDGRLLGSGYTDRQYNLVPHMPAQAEVYLISYYSYEQLGQLNIQTVRLHAELRYCVVVGWWCVPISPAPFYTLPPYTSVRCDWFSCTVIYDRAFSLSELAQIAQE
jgi:hypothetical protein